jgi:TolA-binding protein
MRIRLLTLPVAVLLALSLGSGCAYFNTFYNAKTFFNEAESLRESGGSGDASYRRCIDKCKDLLRTHPNSGYVDDSLYMIGISHFHLKEYVQAQASFTDLIERFPDSDRVERAWFYIGMAALELGDTGGAVAAFDGLERSYPKSRYLIEAEYRAAEVQLESNYDTAREELGNFIEKHPKSEYTRQAQVQIARTYYDEALYAEAMVAYEAALKHRLSKPLRYNVKLHIALSLREQAEVILSDPALYEQRDLPRGLMIDLGQGEIELSTANTLPDSAIAERQRAEQMLESAAQQLLGLRDDAEKLKLLSQLDIEIAVTRALQGSPGRAIVDLDVIARNNLRYDPAGSAYYEIGEIHRRQGELERARDSYNEAARQGTNQETHRLAREKSQAITERSGAMAKLKDAREVLEARRQLQNLVAPGAGQTTLTLQDPRDEAENQVRFEELATQLMRVAEIDLVELDQPRLALREYQMVLTEFAGSSQGPRASFAIAWIYEHRLSDRGSALRAYEDVLRDYPESPQARDARAMVASLTTDLLETGGD